MLLGSLHAASRDKRARPCESEGQAKRRSAAWTRVHCPRELTGELGGLRGCASSENCERSWRSWRFERRHATILYRWAHVYRGTVSATAEARRLRSGNNWRQRVEGRARLRPRRSQPRTECVDGVPKPDRRDVPRVVVDIAPHRGNRPAAIASRSAASLRSCSSLRCSALCS